MNVIRLLEVFENSSNFFIAMEYASSGDLLSRIKQTGRISENRAKVILKQIVEGIAHCHHNQILHRDIKLDNILIDQDLTVKICDFGVSRFIREGEVVKEQCGTPAYIAPEIIKNKGYTGFAADIWSTGVLLYVMITGTFPFTADNLTQLNKTICRGKFLAPSFISPEAQDLLKRMLVIDPQKRFRAEDILAHKWLRKVPLNRSIHNYYNIMDVIYYKQEYLIDFLTKYSEGKITRVSPMEAKIIEMIELLKEFGYVPESINEMLIKFIMNH